MPKLIHNVTLELFVRPGDPSAALDALAPVPLRELREAQWRWHPERERTRIYELPRKGITLLEQETPGDAGPITVLHYRFAKQRDTAAFAEKLREIPREERERMLKRQEGLLDEEGRLILRFALDALARGELRIAPRGPCVVARINLAAFPKNLRSCLAVATQILG